jgi:hypothetical protein
LVVFLFFVISAGVRSGSLKFSNTCKASSIGGVTTQHDTVYIRAKKLGVLITQNWVPGLGVYGGFLGLSVVAISTPGR